MAQTTSAWEENMFYVKRGNTLYKIIEILSVVGEFPMRSIHLIGNARVCKALIHALTKPQLLDVMGRRVQVAKLFSVSGRGRDKTLRFYRSALSVLEILGLNEVYLSATRGHRFSGDGAHRERNHRIAECVAMCMAAGIEFRPQALPPLQMSERLERRCEGARLYLSRALKRAGEGEENKTMYARIVGSLFCPDTAYAVYNGRERGMKWRGRGEIKAMYSLSEIARMNYAGVQTEIAVLFATDKGAAQFLRNIGGKNDFVYPYIRYVPLSGDGVRQLRLIVQPNVRERMAELLFEEEDRSFDRGLFEYDARVNGVYVFSFLDADIARLYRFLSAFERCCEVICFRDQEEFLRGVLPAGISIKCIEREVIERAFGIDKEEVMR